MASIVVTVGLQGCTLIDTTTIMIVITTLSVDVKEFMQNDTVKINPLVYVFSIEFARISSELQMLPKIKWKPHEFLLFDIKLQLCKEKPKVMHIT